MPSTYTLISSNVLSSSAASVTFSAIPATYTDLVVRLSIRCSDNEENIRVTFNGVGGTSYSERTLYGSGTAAFSYAQTSASSLIHTYINPSSSTSNTFANGEIYIPNYLSATSKPLSSFSVTETNATATTMAATAGLFSNSSAITSITLATYSGGAVHFTSGSSFYLYGISNA